MSCGNVVRASLVLLWRKEFLTRLSAVVLCAGLLGCGNAMIMTVQWMRKVKFPRFLGQVVKGV